MLFRWPISRSIEEEVMEKCPKPRSQVKGRGIATSLPRSSLSRAAPWIGKLHPILLLAAALVVVPWSIQSPLWSRWSHKPYHAASWACEALVVGPPLPTPIRGRRSASLTGTLWRNAEAQSSPSSSSSEASSDSAAFVFLSRDAALNELRAGAQAFRRGEVEDSLLHFDRVYAQCPELRPYLWQRGISLYYANRFDEASHQFHMDVQVNPNDVEEIVWDMAAHARLRPNVYPPPNAMVVADIRRDKRRIMPTVYKLFKGQTSEQELFVAGHGTGSSSADEFYSLLYLGLYCEVRGEVAKASNYLQQSLRTSYVMTSRGSTDYMTDVARVHCLLRGWI